MRPVAVVALVTALALAGCTAGSNEPSPPAPADECRLTYPDGSPLDCEAFGVMNETLPTQPPSLEDGWVCTIQAGGPNDDYMQRVYVHQDGRVGMYWDWPSWFGPEGTQIIHLGLFDPQGNQGAHVPLTAQGFYAFPDPPSVEAREGGGVLIRFYNFQLHAGTLDGWTPVGNASLHVSLYDGGEGWYAWNVPAGNGTWQIDIVEEELEDETGAQYRAGKRHLRDVDPPLVATSAMYGHDWSGRYLFLDSGTALSCDEQFASGGL